MPKLRKPEKTAADILAEVGRALFDNSEDWQARLAVALEVRRDLVPGVLHQQPRRQVQAADREVVHAAHLGRRAEPLQQVQRQRGVRGVHRASRRVGCSDVI